MRKRDILKKITLFLYENGECVTEYDILFNSGCENKTPNNEVCQKCWVDFMTNFYVGIETDGMNYLSEAITKGVLNENNK